VPAAAPPTVPTVLPPVSEHVFVRQPVPSVHVPPYEGGAVLPALLGWGTLVGLDLVSFPQGLLSRPLVAATGAGLLLSLAVEALQFFTPSRNPATSDVLTIGMPRAAASMVWAR